MAAITKPVTREIVEDFAKEIRLRKTKTAKPSKAVINFRAESKDGIEREVCRVPIEILSWFSVKWNPWADGLAELGCCSLLGFIALVL